MDLRQYLIAPHEQPQKQPSHHHTLVYTESQHQPQLQQFQSHPQHQTQKYLPQHQQQQLQPQHQPPYHNTSNHQPHHRSLNTANAQVSATLPLLTRDQVLKGLSLYPDILASVLLSQTRVDRDVVMQSQNKSHNDHTAGEYQISHSRLGMLGSQKIDSCYHFGGKEGLGQEQRMERKSKFESKFQSKLESKFETEKRSNIDNTKTVNKELNPAIGNATIPIPTSPRAGRYAKGQRLQRQKRYPQDSHVQPHAQRPQSLAEGQGQRYRSSATATGVSIPTPSKTLKRKASKAEGLSLAGDILNTDTDADASSFQIKKVRKSDMIGEGQGCIGGVSEQPRKSIQSRAPGQRGRDNNAESNGDLDRESDKDSTKDFTKELSKDCTKDSTKPNLTKKAIKKLTKKAKQAHHNSLTTTSTPCLTSNLQPSTPLPSPSPTLYTTFVSLTKPQHTIKASQHHKIHTTCFAWYHGMCPHIKGKYCNYLHALTEPPSYVQPPRGYVHGKYGGQNGSRHEQDGQKNEQDGKTEAAEDTQLTSTVQCTLDWCPGDWLWDHDQGDNDQAEEEQEQEELESADEQDKSSKIH